MRTRRRNGPRPAQRDAAQPGPAGAVLGVFGVDLFRVGLGLVAGLLDD
jgi:hypothetical protein